MKTLILILFTASVYGLDLKDISGKYSLNLQDTKAIIVKDMESMDKDSSAYKSKALFLSQINEHFDEVKDITYNITPTELTVAMKGEERKVTFDAITKLEDFIVVGYVAQGEKTTMAIKLYGKDKIMTTTKEAGSEVTLILARIK